MREIPEGEALFQSVWRRISREAKLAFFGTLIAGLLMHLYMLVNKIPNHDDIIGLFIDNDSTFYGRWFLSTASRPSGIFSIPWVTGLLALIWLSLAAVCVVRLLRIRRASMILLTSATMAAFPTVCYTFCYLFTADAYMLALLLAALGALLTDRFRFGFLLGGLCIGLSLATYQAYVFFAVGLMAVRILLTLLFDPDASVKSTLLRIARCGGALALGAVVYRAGLSLSLAIKQVSLKTYMGLNNAGSLSIADAIGRIPTAYGKFAECCRGNSDVVSGRTAALIFCAMLASALVLAILAAVRMRGPHKPMRVALSAVILCALPLCVNGIWLVSPMGVHALMQYPVSLVYLLVIALYDRLSDAEADESPAAAPSGLAALYKAARTLLGYAIALLLLANSFLWGVDANETYLALELKFDNMMSLVTRMVDRVEQLPEYVPNETPVWYTGTLSDANYGAVKSEAFARASATDMTGREWNYTALMNNLYFSAFVNHYIGVAFVMPEDAEADAVLATDAYRAMPYYPAAGSVQYIDGIIIINGGPNPQAVP